MTTPLSRYIVWRRPRVTLRGQRLQQYVWDTGVVGVACRACWKGSGEILHRTWRWLVAAPSGDRLLRLAVPAGALSGAGWTVRHFPAVAPTVLVVTWLVAAGILAPAGAWDMPAVEPVEEGDEPAVEEPGEASPAGPRAALLDVLDRVTRGRNGVHLEELAEHPELGLTRADIRPLLDTHQVPVTRSLSVDGVAGRSGVRRADVEALLKALPQKAPAAPLAPTLAPVDLRKSQPLSTALTPALATAGAPGNDQ